MSINRVYIDGRLTKDIELSVTQTGKKVVNFDIAVKKTKDTADFFRCSAWGSTAEYLCQYAGKGTLVLIEGKLSQNSYKNRNGDKVTIYEILCNSAVILSNPKKNNDDLINIGVDDNQEYMNLGEEVPF